MDGSCARYFGTAALSGKSAANAEPAADMIAVMAMVAASHDAPRGVSRLGCSVVVLWNKRRLAVKTDGAERLIARPVTSLGVPFSGLCPLVEVAGVLLLFCM
jgi:hypothetical protein